MDKLPNDQLERLVHQVIDDLCGRREKGVDIQSFLPNLKTSKEGGDNDTDSNKTTLSKDIEVLRDFLMVSGLMVKDKTGVTVTSSDDKKSVIYSVIESRRVELKEGVVHTIKRLSHKPFLQDTDWKGRQVGFSHGVQYMTTNLIWKVNGAGPLASPSILNFEVQPEALDNLIGELKKIRDDRNNWEAPSA